MCEKTIHRYSRIGLITPLYKIKRQSCVVFLSIYDQRLLLNSSLVASCFRENTNIAWNFSESDLYFDEIRLTKFSFSHS
jgi:hypothetical protein